MFYTMHIHLSLFVLTSVKSLNRNDQRQQDEYPEIFHFVCFQSELSYREITLLDCWVSLHVVCLPSKLVYNAMPGLTTWN